MCIIRATVFLIGPGQRRKQKQSVLPSCIKRDTLSLVVTQVLASRRDAHGLTLATAFADAERIVSSEVLVCLFASLSVAHKSPASMPEPVDDALRRRLLQPESLRVEGLSRTQDAQLSDSLNDDEEIAVRFTGQSGSPQAQRGNLNRASAPFLGYFAEVSSATPRQAQHVQWKAASRRLVCILLVLVPVIVMIGIVASLRQYITEHGTESLVRKRLSHWGIAATVPLYSEKRWRRVWNATLTYTGQRGFFGVYIGSGASNSTLNKVWLEVPISELEQPFVIDSLITRGDAEAFMLHAPANRAQENWFALRLGKPRPSWAVDLYRPQLGVRIQHNDSELAASYAAGTWTGWSKILRIVAVTYQDALSVNKTASFENVTDETKNLRLILDVTPWVSDGFAVLSEDAPAKLTAQTSSPAKAPWSYRVIAAKAYPGNVEIRVEAMFPQKEAASGWNPSGVSAAEISFQLVRLPSDSLPLRLADERIGYFTTSFLLLDHDEGIHERIDVINRRRLPTVFYIDPTVPSRWRLCLKRGVENWNLAFAQAGWNKSAARVEPAIRAVLPEDSDWPSDYDIGDIRFSTISWSPSLNSVFALGPSNIDPRTGEILNSNIIFTHGWIRSLMRQYTNLVAAQQRQTAPNDSSRLSGQRRSSEAYPMASVSTVRESPALRRVQLVDAARLDTAAFAILEVMALVSDVGDVPERFICDALIDTTMHEVGHALGLRHNFRASANVRWQDLSDPEYVERNGISSSVMDYLPILIFANSQKQTRYFQHVIGAYDILAIRYGYGGSERPTQLLEQLHSSSLSLRQAVDEALTEHRVELAPLAEQAVEAGLHFGTDEDDPSPNGVDVYVSQWDLSDDPLAYHENVRLVVGRALSSLRALVHERDLSWSDYSELVRYALFFGSRSALYATKFLGSIELRRGHPADIAPGRAARTVQVPRKPVDTETMQRALGLLRRLLSPLDHEAILGGGYPTWALDLVEPAGKCDGVVTYCLGSRPVSALTLLQQTRSQVLSLALHPQRLVWLQENALWGTASTLPLHTYLELLTNMFFDPKNVETSPEKFPLVRDAQVDYVLALRTSFLNMSTTSKGQGAVSAVAYELRRIHCLVRRMLEAPAPAAENTSSDTMHRAHLLGLSALLGDKFPPLDSPSLYGMLTVPCPTS